MTDSGSINKTITLLVATDGDETNTSGGTVTGAGTYATGTQITITATPSAGYRFLGWASSPTGNIYNSDDSRTITVWDDVTYYAQFENSTEEKTITDCEMALIFQSGETGTKTTSIQHTPKSGSTISAGVRKWNNNNDDVIPATFTQGVASTETIDTASSLSYDGDKRFTLTVTTGSSYLRAISGVTYTYI